ncbi:MAG: FAD-binding monooxygenase [Phycisphaera sp.]|nr:FAD-binding monooxygenase [Phycisphaera sp.]
MTTIGGRVLVCGAGPTGLVTAIGLARSGVEVVVIDSAAEASPLSRAAVVWRRTLEVLHDAVPSRRFIDEGRIVEGIHIESEGRLLRDVGFPRESVVFPPGVLIPQSTTERILTESLSDLGIEIRRGVELREVAADENEVEVVLGAAGATHRESFEWLIGADGAHSRVRHALGLEFPGESIERRWILADLDVEDSGPEDRIRFFLGHAGMAGLFPYGDGRWRLIADGGPIDLATPRRDPDRGEIEAILAERTSLDWTIKATPWLADFRVNERQVEAYRHGRVLLAGDAAHVHSPAGGQGMNTSIQDAVNLAWKLSMVMRGTASDSLLDTYQAERHPVGAAVVRGSGKALEFAMDRGPLVTFLKRRILPVALGLDIVRGKVVRRLSEIDIHYHGGPLADDRSDRWIGRRLPDLPLAPGGPSIHEEIGTIGFTIITFGGASVESDGLLDAAASAAGPGVRVLAAGAGSGDVGTLQHALEIGDEGVAIIRPDTYLGPVTEDPARVKDWFAIFRA